MRVCNLCARSACVIIALSEVMFLSSVMRILDGTRSNCTLKHHTLLHQDQFASSSAGPTKPKGNVRSVATSTDQKFEKPNVSGFNGAVFQSSDVYLNVVPVRVSCGNKSVVTYAFLDQGPQQLFAISDY